ncbi:MAG: glycosyltransferase family 39 protein [Chloroflexi bacterium]|nr:glycosyltransferase family 39 protein [Chloroflexota bacterium]MBP8056136.1 glycosyltransferase family 39 protein [Chloroflexota bacterium]
MSSKTETILLLLILLLAAGLRLGWPGLTEFKGDEARLTLLALEMAQGEQFPVRGIGSSVGLPNTPMSVWLYALPLLFSHHIYAATLFTGLLNTLAVLGCWWLVRRYWGAETALAAALLFAVSPWAIFHSRKIWAQNLLPFFTLGWGISGLLTFVERKPRWIVAHLLCLGIAAQVHFAGLALVPATGLFLVVFRGRIQWRWLHLGILLTSLTALPFLIYLAQQNISPAQFLHPTPTAPQPDNLSVWQYAWWLITGLDMYTLAGATALPSFRALVPDMTPIAGLIALLLTGGLSLWLWQWRQNRLPIPSPPARDTLFFFFAWLITPLLIFALPFLPVYHHYLLTLYPLPFVAVAGALAALARPTRGLAWGLLPVLVISALWTWGGVLQVMATEATPGGLGTPVRYYLAAAAPARTWWHNNPTAEILIGGTGESTESDEFAAILAALLPDVPYRFVNTQAHALFPAQPSLTILAPSTAPAVRQVYQQMAHQETSLPLRPGEGEITLLWLEGSPAAAVPLDPQPLFANWVQLLGYTPLATNSNTTATWQLYWRTGANPDPTDYHFFNHLLAKDGVRLAQQDGPLFAPHQWREGDQVVSVFTFPWSDGWVPPLTMRIGIYTYPDINDIPLLDVAGNPYTTSLELPAQPVTP